MKKTLLTTISKARTQINKFKLDIKDHYFLIKPKREIANLQGTHSLFFMVGISGAIHLMELSLRFVPSNVNLIIILNGMDRWEQEWVRKNFQSRPIINIDSKYHIAHGKIIDMLFDNLDKSFGIIDYDCFIFDQSCFWEIQKLEPNILINSLFESSSTIEKLILPHTFFLFFNTQLINFIRNKYKITSDYQRDFGSKLSTKVKNKLAEVGIDKDHFPETGKNYFSTLRLLISLGFSEGYNCKILEGYQIGPQMGTAAYHIGGVSYPNWIKGWTNSRGSYFWRRVLRANKDVELIHYYEKKFGVLEPDDIFIEHPEYKSQIGQGFFDFVDRITQT